MAPARTFTANQSQKKLKNNNKIKKKNPLLVRVRGNGNNIYENATSFGEKKNFKPNCTGKKRERQVNDWPARRSTLKRVVSFVLFFFVSLNSVLNLTSAI